MPKFDDLTEDDIIAIASYLINASDKDYQFHEPYNNDGDPEKGQILFDMLGCLACHAIDDKGEGFAPNLSNIATKVYPDWLYNWLKNPKQYNDKTIMPSLRLSDEEARDITAFLLKHGERKPYTDITDIEQKIRREDFIKNGERLIKNRGCFGCHDIPGMEKEMRIAPV